MSANDESLPWAWEELQRLVEHEAAAIALDGGRGRVCGERSQGT